MLQIAGGSSGELGVGLVEDIVKGISQKDAILITESNEVIESCYLVVNVPETTLAFEGVSADGEEDNDY